ncbi:hypothetical protein AC1031_017694 [Aphanomyces cochlioides]|nr:hypothetical protein AC1031_017694 [Aphanomyces cochlioides]
MPETTAPDETRSGHRAPLPSALDDDDDEEPRESNEMDDEAQEGPTPKTSEGGGYYAKWRRDMEKAQCERDQMERELREYLDALTAKVDDRGAAVVHFPDNYDEVVQLMTKSDVSDDSKSTWSRALILDGILRQQAFGVIAGDDVPSELNVKIAHGIAQIRKMDAILDDLDKKLDGGGGGASKTFLQAAKKSTSVQRIKNKVQAAKSLGETAQRGGPAVDFISRNKEMKQAGTCLTLSEAQRVEKLIECDDQLNDNAPHVDATTAPAAVVKTPFNVDDNRADVIDSTLKEMLARRREDSARMMTPMPAMARLDLSQRLVAIDAALQTLRDEELASEMGDDDGTASMRSGKSSLWSRASTRAVSKREIANITYKAKQEVQDDEKAPPEAIKELLESLSAISIEIKDDDDIDSESIAALPLPLSTSPMEESTTGVHKPEPPVRASADASSRRKIAMKAPSTSSFSHLFTLPFEAMGPRTKPVHPAHYR